MAAVHDAARRLASDTAEADRAGADLTSTTLYASVSSMAVHETASATAEAPGCCPPGRLLKPDRSRATAVSATAKALADPVRVQILQLLREARAEVCQCDLQPLFGISQPTLSHHLKKLHAAGLIEVERRGKWAYYAIDEDALEVLRAWVS